MGRAVKCAYCGGYVDKEKSVRYKERNYHEKCCQAAKERERLGEYICQIFNLKAPGPQNYGLIKKYVTEEGYTYKGIFLALKYFYEIQGNNVARGNERIGIVPYVYNEAQKYFEDLENKRDKIKEVVSHIDTVNKINVTISTKQNKPKGRKTYNLNEFLGD